MTTTGVVGNALSAGSLATFMASSLPKQDGTIKNAYEAVALAVHAGMLAVGFQLKGLGEDHHIGKFILPGYLGTIDMCPWTGS
jgi:enolase